MSDKELVRYRITDPWGRERGARPTLHEDVWVRGPKKARRIERTRGTTFGYSVYSHAELERQATTPEEALVQYVAQHRKNVERLIKELDRATSDLRRAESMSIEAGKLVVP